MALISSSCTDSSWWVFTLPAFLGTETLYDNNLLIFSLFLASISFILLSWFLSSGGPAWANNRAHKGPTKIPGPRGIPIFGSIFSFTNNIPHQTLAKLSKTFNAKQLMAFSIGSTPAVVSSDPSVAKEILSHPSFANRPLKRSARELMFARAIGFAPSGTYWRMLRRISSTHLFAPRRIAAHEINRQNDCTIMMTGIQNEINRTGTVKLRHHLQGAALNNIMTSVFGKRYDVTEENSEAEILKQMVREGFELLGAFNWSDHLPWLAGLFDPARVEKRCAELVPRVRKLVAGFIDEHKKARSNGTQLRDNADFVDVLLSLDGDEALSEDDMVAILWEMIFRGTDTTALLTEWAIAELILNPTVQSKLRTEINLVVGPTGTVTDADVARMPYLQVVVKETLRVHPPGPLLSWARLSIEDVHLSNGMVVVPAGTTAMVNMYSITHDSDIWTESSKFQPERFISADVDIRGGDLRLAPFGAGRRVCPGKNLGIVTVGLWVARLVHEFEWSEVDGQRVDLEEVLKLSLEMKKPLVAEARKVVAV